MTDKEGKPVVEKTHPGADARPWARPASQVAIKQLGTNGGGFFNVNSAHPFENPTPLSNFLEMLAILLIGAALCVTFGRMVGDVRQGWAILAAMTIIFVGAARGRVRLPEQAGNPRLLERSGARRRRQHGRQGGALRHRQLGALGHGDHLGLERLGELDARLVHAARRARADVADAARRGGLRRRRLGLYGMLMFAILAVFVAGLMIGRTPEYLGKKIEAFEVKMASLAILLPPLVVLVGTAIAVLVEPGKAGVANPGAHGFSEILYAFSSAGNNNGSAFAGLSANTPVLQHRARVRDAVRALLADGPGARHRRLARGEEDGSAGPGTLPTTRRCSWCC